MSKYKTLSDVTHFNDRANDVNTPIMDRILALCNLYHWYHGDTIKQTETVKRIETLIKHI